jgi:DNA polymerase-3 subunit beta
MKLFINRVELLSAISVVNFGVESSSTSPIQGMANIKAYGNAVYITAVSMDLGIQKSLLANIEIDGEVTLDIKLVSEWASRCRDEEVEIKKNASTISLKCGKSRFNLRLKDVNIPEFPETQEGQSVDSAMLSDLIGEVVNAAEDTTMSSGVGNGIHFEFSEHLVSATATQGTLLLHSSKQALYGGIPNFFLPRKIAQDVKRIIDRNKLETVNISKSDNVTSISTEDTVLFFRNSKASLPKWRSLIPSDKSNCFTVNAEEFREALSRTAVSLGDSCRVTVIVSANAVILTTTGNIGENEETIECLTNKQFTINANYKLLTEALKGVEGKATVVATPRSLIVFREDSEDYIGFAASMA